MKTMQIMVLDLGETQVEQRTTDKFFNATKVLDYYNSKNVLNKRLPDFWINQGTKDFIDALKNELMDHNVGISQPLEVVDAKRGKRGATWMHPYLFVKFCFWLSPEFEVKVIKFVYDNLIEFRLEAGDHYKEMCKAISDTYVKWYDKQPDPLIFVKEINFLNYLVFGTTHPDQRNQATEFQLDLMNRLQRLNINLIRESVSKTIRHKRLSDFAENLKLCVVS